MYRVREVFATLQGEGLFTGRPAVFVRFAGCNLWDGDPKHRARDAVRNGAVCPEWCDTDFARGDKMTGADVVAAVRSEMQRHGWVFSDHVLTVFTGGEPTLQLDHDLCADVKVQTHGPIAIETNGTCVLKPGVATWVDHICVSPKTAPERVVLGGEELKVVWPGARCEPEEYAQALPPFAHYFVSPLAETDPDKVGMSVIHKDNVQRAAQYCFEHPRWRLSLQQHKIVGLP